MRSLLARIAVGLMLSLVAGCGDSASPAPPSVLAAITVSPIDPALFAVAPGQTVALTVAATDVQGASLTGGTPLFTTEDVDVATVNGAGLVTATGLGATHIVTMLTLGGITKTARTLVTVNGAPPTQDVSAPALAFMPGTVDIRAGGTVTWIISAVPHTITFNTAGAPADAPQTMNASVSRAFPASGTFEYHCSIHPSMHGVVRVH